MSTRDDFEAVVWRVAGRRLDRADVGRILAAADAYAIAEGGLTAERRRVLALATARVYRRSVPCRCGCGQPVETPDSRGRTRHFLAGHNLNPHLHRSAA